MKLNDRYIKATLAGIPYLLPYRAIAARNCSPFSQTVTMPQSASARHLRKMSTSIFIPCAVWEFFLRIHPKAGAMIRLLFSTASVLWSFPTAVPLSYTTASSPLFPAKRKTSTRRFLF